MLAQSWMKQSFHKNICDTKVWDTILPSIDFKVPPATNGVVSPGPSMKFLCSPWCWMLLPLTLHLIHKECCDLGFVLIRIIILQPDWREHTLNSSRSPNTLRASTNQSELRQPQSFQLISTWAAFWLSMNCRHWNGCLEDAFCCLSLSSPQPG